MVLDQELGHLLANAVVVVIGVFPEGRTLDRGTGQCHGEGLFIPSTHPLVEVAVGGLDMLAVEEVLLALRPTFDATDALFESDTGLLLAHVGHGG